MKFNALLLALALAVSGCTTHTSGGECVGLLDDKVPGVKYELSVWNVVMAVVFSETVIVPVVVVASDLQCPQEK